MKIVKLVKIMFSYHIFKLILDLIVINKIFTLNIIAILY